MPHATCLNAFGNVFVDDQAGAGSGSKVNLSNAGRGNWRVPSSVPRPGGQEQWAMDEEQAVLQVNEAFYDAFGNADFTAMVEVWAHDDDVACTHPGWNVLTGYHNVIESWRTILEGGAAPKILCREARAFVHGDNAFVTCNEVVNGALLVATNLFIRKSGTWAMVHHHAGPCAMTESPAESASTGSVH